MPNEFSSLPPTRTNVGTRRERKQWTVSARRHDERHDAIGLQIVAEEERLRADVAEAAFLIEVNRARVVLPDAEPEDCSAELARGIDGGVHHRLGDSAAMMLAMHVEPGQLDVAELRIRTAEL